MGSVEVFCSLSDFVGIFLMLAPGIYPRLEDNFWSILLCLVISLYLLDGGALCSFLMRTYPVQVILDSRITERVLRDCME